MSKTTKTLMRKIRRKLTRLLQKEGTHCGHEDSVMEATECRIDFEAFIESEVEKIVNQKGGTL